MVRLSVIQAVTSVIALLETFTPSEVLWVLTQVRSHLVQKPVQSRFTEPVQQVQSEPVHEPGSNGHFEQEGVSSRFLAFWSLYPRKQGKQDALRIYRKLQVDAVLQERILKAVLEQKASEQWTRENGRFIPLPKTWLNRGSWDDEPPVHRPQIGRTEPGAIDRFIAAGKPQ